MAIENGKHIVNGKPQTTVKVTGTTTVQPSKKPELATCPLATFDLPYITFYYNQKLLLYKTTPEQQFTDIVSKLKDGLAEALGYFYPLAGRLSQDDEKALYVKCDGDEGFEAGVEVLEAAAEGVEVAELAAEGNQAEKEKIMQELIPYTGVMNLEGFNRPLLAIQFTKLKDGIAIGCAFNHAVLDGNSTWHFMSAWAELTRTPSSAPSDLPMHNRLAARSTRVPLTLPASPAAHEAVDPNGPAKPLVPRLFHFKSDTVSKLKSSINSSLPPEAKPFSTFQSLSAHIWRVVSRARSLAPTDITAFAVFGDCRPRVDPPMPSSYFGNLIQAIFTGTAAGLLLAHPPSFAAGLLQAAIDAHDSKAIIKRLDEYEAAPKLFHYSDAGMNCVAVGSSPRFKVYEVDFGFGRPERVRSGSNNKFDGMVYLYSGRDGDGSIDVELTLQPEAMERLEKDEEFLSPIIMAK
ncbi:BAHD acyltransferase DCR [Carex littledalei]|uniref:BAHD acyltransferase DCR n=1 Tax=Carex littledalei TaxID=544730 RepID=A0A833QVH7_9POAL|nr:BAHD acyltransferase DCR [Carex littledalei]